MPEPNCERTRELLALGETATAASHLASCTDCRAEARRIRRVTEGLALRAAVEPPALLDARIRRMLAAAPSGILSRPWLAGSLAVASFAVVVSGLATILAQTPLGELGPALAVALGSAWLALSSAAALPVLMMGPTWVAARTRSAP